MIRKILGNLPISPEKDFQPIVTQFQQKMANKLAEIRNNDLELTSKSSVTTTIIHEITNPPIAIAAVYASNIDTLMERI